MEGAPGDCGSQEQESGGINWESEGRGLTSGSRRPQAPRTRSSAGKSWRGFKTRIEGSEDKPLFQAVWLKRVREEREVRPLRVLFTSGRPCGPSRAGCQGHKAGATAQQRKLTTRDRYSENRLYQVLWEWQEAVTSFGEVQGSCP